MDPGDRLQELEIKLAHMERGLQQLSDVVVRQQQEIDRLSQRGRQLLEHLESLQADPEEDAATRVELPPHY
ncbi:MAG: SlyX family protein [Pseudomonadota bacterium]